MPVDSASTAGDLEFLYVDDDLLILNKPPGLLSVPGKGPDKQDCLSQRVQDRFSDALVVHRLDMATSGLLVMARGAAAQRKLNHAFASRTVQKRYVAVVYGKLRTDADVWQVIDLPIVVDWPNRPLRIIDRQRGQPSVTRFRVLSFDAATNTTRVELEPVTGRSHQLRVHLQALGHPILGDSLYATPPVIALSLRLQLHACALDFEHPATGEPLHFEYPPDF